MRPRRRESPRAGAAGHEARSIHYRNLVNPFEPVRLFSDDEIESLHDAALGLLERQECACFPARPRGARRGGSCGR